jgi:hypothetical protein
MGSPKGKGSGHKIVRMIEDRMKAIGDIEFAYLFLKDAKDFFAGLFDFLVVRQIIGGARCQVLLSDSKIITTFPRA